MFSTLEFCFNLVGLGSCNKWMGYMTIFAAVPLIVLLLPQVCRGRCRYAARPAADGGGGGWYLFHQVLELSA